MKNCLTGSSRYNPNGLKRNRNRKINNPKAKIVRSFLLGVSASLYVLLKKFTTELKYKNKSIQYFREKYY
jgi:hypothetical protein